MTKKELTQLVTEQVYQYFQEGNELEDSINYADRYLKTALESYKELLWKKWKSVSKVLIQTRSETIAVALQGKGLGVTMGYADEESANAAKSKLSGVLENIRVFEPELQGLFVWDTYRI